MKSQYQTIRNKKRLAIYLLKLSARGEIINTNLRHLLQEIYEATGEIFAKTDYGVVFEAFLIINSDEVCNPLDKLTGCGEGYSVSTGICSSEFHKPTASILLPALADQRPNDFNPFPANIHTVTSILPTLKHLSGLKKQIVVKFRRDFGDVSFQKHWHKSMQVDRYKVLNHDKNDDTDFGIIEVFK